MLKGDPRAVVALADVGSVAVRHEPLRLVKRDLLPTHADGKARIDVLGIAQLKVEVVLIGRRQPALPPRLVRAQLDDHPHRFVPRFGAEQDALEDISVRFEIAAQPEARRIDDLGTLAHFAADLDVLRHGRRSEQDGGDERER